MDVFGGGAEHGTRGGALPIWAAENSRFQPRLFSFTLIAKLLRGGGAFFRREAAPHEVLGDHAREQKMWEVIPPARLRATAGHLESAKGMPGPHGPGDAAVDIQVARLHFGFSPFDVAGAAQEK